MKPLRALIIEDSEDDTALLLRELKNGGYEPQYTRVVPWEAFNCTQYKSYPCTKHMQFLTKQPNQSWRGSHSILHRM